MDVILPPDDQQVQDAQHDVADVAEHVVEGTAAGGIVYTRDVNSMRVEGMRTSDLK